jgi:hypothetical protein
MPKSNPEIMLARCGYRCDLCAARSDDPDVRQRLVDLWRKYYGHQNYTVENVRCDGCLADGRLADKTCGIRPCAIEKGLDNCACCDDYPCDILKNTAGLNSRKSFTARFGQIPEEDHNICMRMFENEPRLKEIRKTLGKE